MSLLYKQQTNATNSSVHGIGGRCWGLRVGNQRGQRRQTTHIVGDAFKHTHGGLVDGAGGCLQKSMVYPGKLRPVSGWPVIPKPWPRVDVPYRCAVHDIVQQRREGHGVLKQADELRRQVAQDHADTDVDIGQVR